jgi:hypothetical protein
MTDDFKERLRNPDHNWHEAACAKAEHRIEAQAAEIERLRELIKVTGDHWLALQHKHPIQWEGAIDGAMAAACAEIERLREAGNDLGFYAGHEDACDCVKGWAKGPCNCGYTEAWQAWHNLAGKAEQ